MDRFLLFLYALAFCIVFVGFVVLSINSGFNYNDDGINDGVGTIIIGGLLFICTFLINLGYTKH